MAKENSESKRKGGGGKLARSQIVTVRLDAQLHYLAELAARKHRRTLSSFVEWAIQRSFFDVMLYQGSSVDGVNPVSLKTEEGRLWNVDPSERAARLAILYPELLTHEEQERWQMLADSQLLAPAIRRSHGDYSWDWPTLNLDVFPMLRRHWDELLVAHENGTNTAKEWVNDIREKMEAGVIYKSPAPHMTEKRKESSGADSMDSDLRF